MVATSVARRRATSVDELFDEARAIADSSADPEATYEGFLRGLEMGLSAGTLSPVLSKEIGNRLADLRAPERADTVSSSPDPRKSTIRKAPQGALMTEFDFPTEWTLEP